MNKNQQKKYSVKNQVTSELNYSVPPIISFKDE